MVSPDNLTDAVPTAAAPTATDRGPVAGAGADDPATDAPVDPVAPADPADTATDAPEAAPSAAGRYSSGILSALYAVGAVALGAALL